MTMIVVSNQTLFKASSWFGFWVVINKQESITRTENANYIKNV